MITIIYGEPGMGKTALLTHFLIESYEQEGADVLQQCIEQIDQYNMDYARRFSYPDQAPYYTNYDVCVHLGYQSYFEPYFINPFYLGMPTKGIDVQHVAPVSRVFLSEVQKYYDSRQSKTFPEWVSRLYEQHRHFGMEMYLELQRADLVDLNIRRLCKRFIKVCGIEHKKDKVGEIYKSIFRCHETYSLTDYELYQSGSGKFTETVYVHEGNIFENYNSYSSASEFLPPEGEDFSYMPARRSVDMEHVKKCDRKYYSSAEPEEFRKKVKEGNENENENRKNRND